MRIYIKRYLLLLQVALFLMLSGMCMSRNIVWADTNGDGIRSITTYYDGRWFRVRGPLPEGLTLQVEAYSPSEGLELVRENIDGLAEPEDIQFAYDLTLVDDDGYVYEPDETMDMSISDRTGNAESGLLYHVSDEAREVDYRMTGGLINFQTDGFSPYILLEENKVQDAAPGTGPYVISLPRSQSSKPRLYVSAASSNPSIQEDSGYDKVVMREGTGASGEAYTYRDIWLIQEVPGTRYYFIRNIFNQGNMGSAQMGALGIWYPNAGSDTHQFQITRNSDGTYTFHLVGLSKYGTDCVLDVAGGEESAATGTRVLSYGANGGNNQRFELHKAQTHNISCNLTEGHLSVNHHTGNEFAVWDLNSPSLPQNTADHINGMENVFTPSDSGIHVSVIQPTDTYPFGNAKRAQIISEATDGTYLPIFKVSMDKWNEDWSNPSRYIEVVYPEAGTMRVNGRTIKAGAVLRFYNIRPSDPASGRTFQLAKDAKDINDDPDVTNLYIATNLYRGYWMIGASAIDIDLTLYDSETYEVKDGKGCFSGEPLSLENAFLTFNSLNGETPKSQASIQNPNNYVLGVSPNQAYTEYVGKLTHEQADSAVYQQAYESDYEAEGFVLSETQGNGSSGDNELVTNVVCEDLEIWEPLSHSDYNFGTYRVFAGHAEYSDDGVSGQAAVWEDRIGGQNFTRNSVTLPMAVRGEEHPTTASFIIGSMEGSMWVSFSSIAVDGEVYGPVKTIDQVEQGSLANNYNLKNEAYAAEVSSADKDPYMDQADISLENGAVLYHMIQKVPQLGIDINQAMQAFSVTDEIDDNFEILEVGVGSSGQNKDGLWSATVNEQLVTFTYNCQGQNAFKESLGQPGTLDFDMVEEDLFIRVKPRYGVAETNKQYKNYVNLNYKTSAGTENSIISNKVYVNLILPFGKIEIYKNKNNHLSDGSAQMDDVAEGLTGVCFELYTYAEGSYHPVTSIHHEKYGTIVKTYGENGYDVTTPTLQAITDDTGKAVFEGLSDGDYYILETKTEAGYDLMGDYVPVTVSSGKGQINLSNYKRTILNTGGPGARNWFVPGLILLGAGLWISRREMRKSKIK